MRRSEDAASAPRVGALEPPVSRHPRSATSIVPDPADCVCGCCAQLIKALAGIKAELHRLNERLNQIDSESAGWPT